MHLFNGVMILGLVFPLSIAVASLPNGAHQFAKSTIEAKSGSSAKGTVTLAQRGDELLVDIEVKDLAPGKHAIHVHEKGDCSAADASSAGEHFNPTHEKHAGPNSSEHHIGDFGNITAKKDGDASTVVMIKNRKDKPYNWKELIGKSIVIHKNQDDLSSQPSGNSGDRVACGVIQMAE